MAVARKRSVAEDLVLAVPAGAGQTSRQEDDLETAATDRDDLHANPPLRIAAYVPDILPLEVEVRAGFPRFLDRRVRLSAIGDSSGAI